MMNTDGIRGAVKARVNVRTSRLEPTACVCAWCHAVRTGVGEWTPADRSPRIGTARRLTHGICPACVVRFFVDSPDCDFGDADGDTAATPHEYHHVQVH